MSSRRRTAVAIAAAVSFLLAAGAAFAFVGIATAKPIIINSRFGLVRTRLVLSSTSIPSGSSAHAQLVVWNDRGTPIRGVYCGSPFQVNLVNGNVNADTSWLLCAQPLTIPNGRSVWPVTLDATYNMCGNGSGLVSCVAGGAMPSLPPGNYKATVEEGTDPYLVPLPPPTPVRVT